jgi:hypothetical protein
MAGAYRQFVTACFVPMIYGWSERRFASELGGCLTTPLEVKALLKADQA